MSKETKWGKLKSIILAASSLKNSIDEFNASSDSIKIESGQALLVKGIDKIADHWAFEPEVIQNTIKVLKLYDIDLMEGMDETV